MPVRDIVTLPNPVLRRKAHKVTVFDKELQELIDDMIETMRNAPGVGLAAPHLRLSFALTRVRRSTSPLKSFTIYLLARF